MIKAGSISAVIGSLIGLVLALSAFSIGETAERLGVEGSEFALSVGAIGVVMNVSCLVMGLACFFEPKKIYGISMMVFGIIGVIMGNMVYATAMFLVLFGGVAITKELRKSKVV